MTSKLQTIRRAVTEFVSWHDGYLAYRDDHDKWATLCTDGKWRLVNQWDFDEFVSRWAARDFWWQIPCDPNSEFMRIVEVLLVGRPRLAGWKSDPSMRADDRVYEHCQINGYTQDNQETTK